jgi:type I restriction enzyme S subunit
MTKWPMVPLGEVLQLQRRWVKVDPLGTYEEIGVRCFGNGIFHKAPIDGSTLGNKRVLRIEPGDLVFNNVFAWEGAVAVASEAEAGKIGSHRFVTYTVDPCRCSADYLRWFFKSEPGLEILRKVSPGSAGRNRTMSLDQLPKQQIPLPPLREQQRLVEYLDTLSAKIREAKQLRNDADVETVALTNAVRRSLIGEQPSQSWIPLSTYVAEIQNGWSPSCEKRPAANGEWAVLKVGAVSFGTYDPTENKALPKTLSPLPEYEVKAGDFLMSRANTFELVGACAYVEQTPSHRMLSDKLFRFLFHPGVKVDRHYLNHVLKSPAVRDQIVRVASGTSPTMKNISKEKVLSLLIPAHSFAQQKELAARLSATQVLIDTTVNQQVQLSEEIDAMLPGILGQVFGGDAA